MIHQIRTVDAHVGGQPVRVILEGVPDPPGHTLADKRRWLLRHADRWRRALLLPPRGHIDLSAVCLATPVTPGAHAALVFMDAAGYPALDGQAAAAAATIALQYRLLFPGEHTGGEPAQLRFDTPAGSIGVTLLTGPDDRVTTAALTLVASFVHTPALPVPLATRTLRADIAFAGRFYALVDTESTGIPLTAARLPDLRRLGVDMLHALSASAIAHPVDTSLGGVAGVIFTGPADDGRAHLRTVVIGPRGAADWSPSPTGAAAVMTVLDAMGLLPDEEPFVAEGLSGARVSGAVTRRTRVGDYPAIVPSFETTAWVTGEHVFHIDEDDPFADGIILD